MAQEKYLLEVKNLRTFFKTKYGILPAVNGVDVNVQQGEVLGVVGESGCGKSVMSMSILKLIEKYGGEIQPGSVVRLEGKDILDLTEKQLCNLRGKEISLISQDPMTALNPSYTIKRQMTEMMRHHLKLSKKEAFAKAIELLKTVGIPEAEKRINEYPHQLSGGMCQRVVIAMALSCNPKVLIADEPTTALDVTIQAQILQLMKELKDETDAAILLITHDMGVVADMADNIMVMYAGDVVEYGTKQQVFKDPLHPYTKGLLASVPRLDKQVDRLFSINGSVPNMTKKIEGCIFRERCSYSTGRCARQAPPVISPDGFRKVGCWLYAEPHGEMENE